MTEFYRKHRITLLALTALVLTAVVFVLSFTTWVAIPVAAALWMLTLYILLVAKKETT